ncbi:hypothetical protein PUR49_17510 [Streptomyces sp. BE147]|uniref:hypothetical protein n=1 Tax=Streptomyces sp. BE147 TaxID=3002524 RepID=UPI002E79AAA3|nr:hypothetical protein [Streptomyces sp. BE147]MEE1738291.1 hypothetical protein [Streptomyces sp. BE147]
MKRPVNHGRRAGRLAAALLVLAGGPLAGCGIQETAVIDAGSPVVADLLPPREGRVLVFFFSPGNELLPVPRVVASQWRDGAAVPAGPDEPYGRAGPGGPPPAGEDEPLSPFAAVTALLAGPDRAERRAGLRSAPSLPRTASAVVRIVRDGPTVEVELRLRVTGLTAPARDQIVCTAAYAADAQGAVSVRLVGREGRLAPADCPVRPVPAPAR